MNNFCVLHITKYKGDLSRIGAHIDRLHIPHNANKKKAGFNEDIYLDEAQTLKVHLNDILGTKIDRNKSSSLESHSLDHGAEKLSLQEAVDRRIKEGHTIISKRTNKVETIRKDAVLAVGIILTGSHERMMEIEQDKKLFDDWKKANYEFVSKRFKKENIVRFVLHIDEKTPHLHCIFVPINPENRLSASSYLDWKLKEIQDEYATMMKPFGFERGISKELTQAVHKDTADWRREQNQALNQSEAIQIVSSIKKSNFLQLDKIQKQAKEAITELNIARSEEARKNKLLNTTNQNLIEGQQQLAYQKTLEEYSHKVYEWIKREIPLAPFLTNELGWTIDKRKSSQRDMVLKNPSTGEKIIVPTSPKATTGHWVYSNVNGGRGGTLINLLLEAQWTWQQIRSLADGKFIPQLDSVYTSEPPKKVTHAEEDPILQEKKARAYIESIVASNSTSFLDHRSILRETYQDLKGLKVSTQAAVFELYKDFDKEGNASLCSTITYLKDHHGNNRKRFQKGLPRGLSVLADEKGIAGATKIIITESPVDALSYRQLSTQDVPGWKTIKLGNSVEEPYHSQERVVLISTCGNLNFQAKRDFEIIFELASTKDLTIVIAMDNDLAGKEMAETLIHMTEEAGCKYRYEIPTIEKDWNDILMHQDKFQERELSKTIAQKQWQEFEEKAYEDSLLHTMGIEKDTYLAFHNRVKTNEEAVLVALGEEKIEEAEVLGTWSLKKKEGSHTEYTEIAPSVSILKGDPAKTDQVVLVASPMDALIHYQNQDNKSDGICYVYADSQTKNKLARPLIELLEQANINKIVIASSQQNEDLTKPIEEILQKQKLAYTNSIMDIAKPTLQYTMIQKHWKELEERPYEESLLKHLGIEKETYLAFHSSIKTSENAVFVASATGENKEEMLPTWTLQWDAKQGLKEQIKEESILTVLKGEISKANQIVLAASPIDALIHYQTQEKNLDNICYVYADARSREALKEPLKELKKVAKEKSTNVVIARYGQENEYLTKRIQNLFKEDTLKDYTNRLKKEVPLIPFLTNELGWTIDKQKNTQNIVLVHPTNEEKIIVPTSPKATTGHWIYSDINGEEGTLIDLLLIGEKWSWKQIIALAETKFLPPIEIITDDKIAAEYSILTTKNILRETYEDLKGLKVSPQTAVFELYKDFGQEGNANLCSTITYFKDKDGNNSKYFQKGLPRGLSVLQAKSHSFQEADTIVITESPIDALSYHQLNNTTHAETPSYSPDKTVLISTCGNLTTQIKKDLEQIFELAKRNNQTVVIAFNHDLASQNISKSLSYMLKKEGVKYKVEVPSHSKTWNEMLVNQENMQTIEKSQHIAHKHLQVFEENSYESSLLNHIGIGESTYEAFRQNTKINERAVIMTLRDINTTVNESVDTWTLSMDSAKELKEHVNVDSIPTLSILKGDLEQANEMVFVASPLDALAYYQSQAYRDERTCYVYANTHSKSKLENSIVEVLEKKHMHSLILASSKQSGHLIRTVGEILQERDIAYTGSLVDMNKLAQEHLITNKWNRFKEKPYENSLLRQLGIEKETYNTFKDILKISDKEVRVALKQFNNGEIPSFWRLGKDKENRYQEHIEGIPTFSILKGSMSLAEKLIFVTSPLEALIHHQQQPQEERTNNRTCYIYADAKDAAMLKESHDDFKRWMAQMHYDYLSKESRKFRMGRRDMENMELVIASGENNKSLANKIENLFKGEQLSYRVETVIGSALGLIGALLNSNTWKDGDEDERKKKKYFKNNLQY